jgi:hypothetical protein
VLDIVAGRGQDHDTAVNSDLVNQTDDRSMPRRIKAFNFGEIQHQPAISGIGTNERAEPGSNRRVKFPAQKSHNEHMANPLEG